MDLKNFKKKDMVTVMGPKRGGDWKTDRTVPCNPKTWAGTSLLPSENSGFYFSRKTVKLSYFGTLSK